MREILRERLRAALNEPFPVLTRRDARFPGVSGKALAVIGVRRAGKTSLLWHCLAERLKAGAPREGLLLFGLEDDRLAGMTTEDLSWLLEEYFRQVPHLRGTTGVTLAFDEIQEVPGWERFLRRLIDTETVQLLVSGSSSKLLSREIATSLRGRALEVLLHPFSFRESLRHAGLEPSMPWDHLSKNERSALDARLRTYLAHGGFPEAQNLADADRLTLLKNHVDVVVLRDVIERHAVSNPLPLRWLQRQLLANPAGSFSVQKFHDQLKSQGVAVAKDTLHAFLSHLEDAFLVRLVGMNSASERQRLVNPRKVYPVDPGLIPLFERSGRPNLGHALETVVLLELERRGYETGYVRTAEGWEVDFLAHAPGRPTLLVQVCTELQTVETWCREIRALEAARALHPDALCQLVTLDPTPPGSDLPPTIHWSPAAQWLMDTPAESAQAEA
jgi:predicted AAA+ superfamily ATPase